MTTPEQNSLNDLIASGGLPEATPLGEKSREQLIADKDFLFQTNKNFRAEIISITAECNDLHDEIEKCCKELGDAGILITQGPRDGITKLINERDELKAERDAAVGKPDTNIIQKEMLRDEFVRGLELARHIIHEHPLAMRQVLQAEINKARSRE